MRIFKECNHAAFWADPAAGFARLFDAGERVLRAPDGALCLFGHAKLTTLAREPSVEGVAIAADAFGAHIELASFYGAGLFARSGQRHRQTRRAALAGLGGAPVATRADEIAAVVQQALADCPTETPADLAQDLVLPLTARVWARVAGYPAGAESDLAAAVAALSDPGADAALQANAARDVLALTRAAWHARASPFMKAIADAMPLDMNADPVPLVAAMAVDGIDSAAAGLAGALTVLLRQPPDSVSQHGVEPCLQEALRLAMPVILSMRQSTENTAYADIEIPRGTVLWMWWGAGCMDPAAYPTPDRFEPGRAGPRAPVFGAGAHACLGHVLIRTIALPLISDAFGGMGQLAACGPALPGLPWRVSRLPRQSVIWSPMRQA
ncbi:cytochrome P450 [Pararhodobacter sp. SW119]|uniref:cytochrome P450 n=1 Tax=Pararhodobacter sp. SW119 TaxID=2780075 RepID=UPI001AE0AEF8|nr:cytochrome P450 [Pararhodobacter sp. SW119]